MFHPRARRVLGAALLAGALLASPPVPARAESLAGATDEGLQKLLKYASCAIATFIAISPERMGQALLGCGMLYLEEVS